MTDEQDEAERAVDEGAQAPGDAESRTDTQDGAFLALGLVFFVLGLSGVAGGDSSRTVFLAVGVVFIALAASRTTASRRGGRRGGRGDGSPGS
ncbi:hypothetical protein [Cellulomonas wangsupingiae]|uniref:Uncharacterized protein n=1 Tax=Cellulomonas wangsupingiae TaxID=2968085 RepID=A0ABY5K7L4_9CELL|nr:hypothetical protein [Cellulomonas wangsupingiae]MCC2333879.1 hypothetical protein [Cellulomonas wangsupingiae]UUI65137.1 hypothetical protein NP075_18845 [Cellulomonas wangsupingiae]